MTLHLQPPGVAVSVSLYRRPIEEVFLAVHCGTTWRPCVRLFPASGVEFGSPPPGSSQTPSAQTPAVPLAANSPPRTDPDPALRPPSTCSRSSGGRRRAPRPAAATPPPSKRMTSLRCSAGPRWSRWDRPKTRWWWGRSSMWSRTTCTSTSAGSSTACASGRPTERSCGGAAGSVCGYRTWSLPPASWEPAPTPRCWRPRPFCSARWRERKDGRTRTRTERGDYLQLNHRFSKGSLAASGLRLEEWPWTSLFVSLMKKSGAEELCCCVQFVDWCVWFSPLSSLEPKTLQKCEVYIWTQLFWTHTCCWK